MRILFLIFLFFSTNGFCDSELTISGKTAQAHIIQVNGVSFRPRPYLNFIGATGTDVGGKTLINIGGGGVGGFVSAPSFSNEPCTQGQYSADTSYYYICESDNTWFRVAISTFTSSSNNYLTFKGNYLTFKGNYLTF